MKRSRGRSAWAEAVLKAADVPEGSFGRLSAAELRGIAPRQPAPPAPPPRAPRKRRRSKLELELEGQLRLIGLDPLTEHRFHDTRRWRFDFAFLAARVLLDVDGSIFAAENEQTAGKHARGAGICNDMEKRNAAAELGWCVLSYGPPHIRSGEAAMQIQRIVAARSVS
jgi:very-short-patch-repair endonuclease